MSDKGFLVLQSCGKTAKEKENCEKFYISKRIKLTMIVNPHNWRGPIQVPDAFLLFSYDIKLVFEYFILLPCSDFSSPQVELINLKNAKLQSVKYEIVEELKATIFTELKNEIASLSSQMSQLQTSYSQLQDENDHLKSDVRTLQERISVSVDQLLELRSQFCRQQQQARMNNLEIVGLPQTSSKSPVDLVLKIAEYAGVPQKALAGRPKPIVAKLADRLYKDKILSGLKNKKGICTRDISIAETLKIWGNHNIHIGLVNAPPDSQLPIRLESIYSRLAEVLATHPNDYFILCGDFNLPNVTWTDSGPTLQKRGPVELQNAF
ncbi:unnamed protein product, partial [Leptidea sinapis]